MSPPPSPHDLLLEIGVEELPSSFVDAALAALPALVESRLGAVRLAHGAVKAYGTARRLAVVVQGLAGAQLDLDEEVTGPPETAAFKDGKPTKAAEAFANKLGVAVSELVVVDKTEAAALGASKQKPGRYVVGRRVEKGKPARELLGKVLADVCGAIPFRKSMRWGAGDATFGRPVQWLVALHGDDLVDVGFAGVRSTAKSRGHRFLSPESFVVKNAGAYLDQLRHHHVLADRDERAKTMMERVAAAAKAAGGTYDPEPFLVDENASLVEEPHVVTGSFDPAFLALPAEVIRAVARGHQRYFCVQKSDGGSALGAGRSAPEVELLPHYITVVNTALAPAKIAKGNDNTMRARLSDARFFFEEDKKAKLEDRVAKLAGIVFHNKLGTLREKIARVERLAGWLAERLGMSDLEQVHVKRAAHLCKSDLVSLMVGEFPELQGTMGRTYALHAGEPAAVADAIRDHYKPVGAADDVAPGDVGALVGLADRLDSLVGCFGVGLAPTGAADPFALRRACIGILRTLLDKGGRYGKLTVTEMLGAAYDGYEGAAKPLEVPKMETVAKVEGFTAERFRGLLASETSSAVADAVMGGHNQVEHDHRSATEYPVYTRLKARVLQAALNEQPAASGLEKARTVAKRLSGISKEHAPRFHVREDFTKQDDAAIHAVVHQVHEATRALTTEAAVSAALASAIDLAQKIDAIFLSTLVNDPADPLTPKRLELLSYGADCMLRLADFARLGGAAS
jgi:glycyl-tRNA synthetase beta chain